MKYEYSYIHFAMLDKASGKTEVWLCLNNRSGAELGVVKWYGPWRQYCFFPEAGTVFNRDCLLNVMDFINQLMKARKG